MIVSCNKLLHTLETVKKVWNLCNNGMNEKWREILNI